MHLSLRKKKEDFFCCFWGNGQAINCHYNFLPDQVRNKMFMGRYDILCLPEYPDFLQERINDFCDGLFKAVIVK